MAAGINTQGKMVITDLDFDTIKSNLKTYMESQSEFTDYDFTGAGLNVLLDVLAYNTHYNAFMANMLASEMFLDSASKRSSITSHAKALGYTPTSIKAPIAYVNVTVNDATTASITLPVGYPFTTTVSGNNYQFVNISARTLQPSSGVYTYSSIPIYEGTWITTRFTVDSEDPDQRFIIPNEDVDISTIAVSVQNSSSDTTTTSYTKANNIVSISATTAAYFIQETIDNQWEVYFGDGIVGKKLSNGNIVILSYVVTNGADANGASLFKSGASISGFNSISVDTSSVASGGAEAESDASIKYNAPFNYAAQNRTVTAGDYKVIVPALYPNVSSIAVWGGEYSSPAVYGKVYISIQPKTGASLTTATKTSIINLLQDYNVASITPEIVDPTITKIVPTVNFKFNESATTKTSSDLAALVTTSITNYSTIDLEKFESVFRHSVLTTLIDNVDSAILNNITTVKISKTFIPTLATGTKYTISFSNALQHPHMGHLANQSGLTASGILTSSGFTQTGKTPTYYLDDDGGNSTDPVGTGKVWAYYVSGTNKVYESAAMGTINYITGEVVLTKPNIATVGQVDGLDSTVIKLTVIPASYDVVPVRNQLLQIDTTNLSVTGAVDTIAAGASDAGVNYTTTSSY